MRETVDLGRRRFLTGRAPVPPSFRPPWLAEAAAASCTGCGACVGACPERVLTLSASKPEIAFADAGCTFCAACADACPEALFDRGGPAFTHAVAIGDACLPRRGVDCQICRDACPEAAIRFRPRRGGPFLPEIRAEACTGCGACIGACPTAAIRLVHPGEAVDA